MGEANRRAHSSPPRGLQWTAPEIRAPRAPVAGLGNEYLGNEYTDVTRLCSSIPRLPRPSTRNCAGEGLCDIFTHSLWAHPCSLREFFACARPLPVLPHFKGNLRGEPLRRLRDYATLARQPLHLRLS